MELGRLQLLTVGTCCADGDGLQATLILGRCSVSLKIMVSLPQACKASPAASRTDLSTVMLGSGVKLPVAALVCHLCDRQAGTTSQHLPRHAADQARLQPVPCHAAGVVLFHHLFDMKPGLLKLFPFKDSSGRPVDSVSACTLSAVECAHPRPAPHPHAVRSCWAPRAPPL